MEQRPKKPTNKGPAEWFTGDVWIDPIAQGQPPSKLNVGALHFTPGARTAWHSQLIPHSLVTPGCRSHRTAVLGRQSELRILRDTGNPSRIGTFARGRYRSPTFV